MASLVSIKTVNDPAALEAIEEFGRSPPASPAQSILPFTDERSRWSPRERNDDPWFESNEFWKCGSGDRLFRDEPSGLPFV